METKKIIECLEMCAEKLGCQRYIVGNCEENVRIGNVLDEAAERLEELEKRNDVLHEDNSRLLDRIADYECRIAELKKQLSENLNWISVEDERKPKNLHNYFIAYVFGTCDEHLFGESMYIADKGNGIVDGAHFTNEGVDGMRVTHWMEIPKLPEPTKPKVSTFKDVLLEKFPEANFDLIVAALCVHVFFPQFDVEKHVCRNENCEQCWSRPYFKEEGGE